MTIVPFPNNFEIYFQNAMDALMSGNFEEAVAFIDKALAIKMDDELFNIGVSLLQSQNQAEKNRAGVKAGLEAEEGAHNLAMAKFIS